MDKNGTILKIINEPCKFYNEIRRIIYMPFVQFYFFYKGVKLGKQSRIFGFPSIQRYRGSKIRIGDYFVMRNWASSNPLSNRHFSVMATLDKNSLIEIGNNVKMTTSVICSKVHVKICQNCLIGANTIITDTDFHPLTPEIRRKSLNSSLSKEVIIENDVFVGMNTIILKGSTVGSGSTIGAGSVVAGNFPERVIIAGNPAKVIRRI